MSESARSVEVRAQITATVWLVQVEVGHRVRRDQDLMVLESMKMEIPVPAPVDGTVVELLVRPEAIVQEGALLAVIRADVP